MALLTYDIRGLGQTATDRRSSIMRAVTTGDPRWAAINQAVGEQYRVMEASGAANAAEPSPMLMAGGLPTWVKWALGATVLAIGGAVVFSVVRKRRSS